MATKKKEEKIEVVEGKTDEPEQPEQEAAVVVPEFGFPPDYLGNSWFTYVKRPLYFAQFLDPDFTYRGETYKGGAYAVTDDDGNEQIISSEDFARDFVGYPTQTEHQPKYLLDRALEKEAKAAKEAEGDE